MAEIDKLAGFVPEPVAKEQVLEAARELQQPFAMREIVNATGLPKFVVHRVLRRCVGQGILRSDKGLMGIVTPRGGHYQKSVYLYSFVAAA